MRVRVQHLFFNTIVYKSENVYAVLSVIIIFQSQNLLFSKNDAV